MEDKTMIRYGVSHDITINDLSDEDKLIVLKNVKNYKEGRITLGELTDLICCKKMQMHNILGSIYAL